MSYLRRVLFEAAESPTVDAYGRLRVSEPVGIFDTQLEYDTHPLLWEDVTTTGGSVTHLPNESAARLRVDTTSGASAIRQSREYVRYQPGRSQLVKLTFVLGATNTNVTKLIGLGDAKNGIFLRQDGDGTLNIVRRTYVSGSAVDNVVAQSSWNLDKLNGSGRSGITFDATKLQVLIIDLSWLSGGHIRVGFQIGGPDVEQIVYAHDFQISNILTTASTTTANLPVRYEITATGVAGGQTDLIEICSAVFSEGGFETERGFPFAIGNGITTISVSTRRPILSMRPKSTFNSIVNRARLDLETVEVYAAGGALLWEVIYNGTLTGASFGSVHASSVTDFDIAATAISGGIPIARGFVPGATNPAVSNAKLWELRSRLPIVLDAAGSNPIPVSVVCTAFSGSVNSAAELTWREHY